MKYEYNFNYTPPFDLCTIFDSKSIFFIYNHFTDNFWINLLLFKVNMLWISVSRIF